MQQACHAPGQRQEVSIHQGVGLCDVELQIRHAAMEVWVGHSGRQVGGNRSQICVNDRS